MNTIPIRKEVEEGFVFFFSLLLAMCLGELLLVLHMWITQPDPIYTTKDLKILGALSSFSLVNILILKFCKVKAIVKAITFIVFLAILVAIMALS